MKLKKLYVDIDGVLLTKKQPRKAEGVDTFIDFAISNFQCYWLTTHCKGDSQTALNYLTRYFESSMLNKLTKFKSTTWDALKTDGIDLKSDFYWLDDAPLKYEVNYLKSINKSDRLIIVNLENQNELERIKSQLPTASIKI